MLLVRVSEQSAIPLLPLLEAVSPEKNVSGSPGGVSSSARSYDYDWRQLV